MITAIDSNVLIDVLTADEEQGTRSGEAVRRALAEGSIIACDVVVAEVASWFPNADIGAEALRTLDIAFDPISEDAAVSAGRAWWAYRDRGGTRARLIADFLIGAHAHAHADRLLTRDRGVYRTYFADLIIVDPSR